jgi:hypothetical protein
MLLDRFSFKTLLVASLTLSWRPGLKIDSYCPSKKGNRKELDTIAILSSVDAILCRLRAVGREGDSCWSLAWIVSEWPR